MKATKGPLCSSHANRLRRYGDPLAGPGRGSPGKRRGIRNMAGRYVTDNGYVRVHRPGGVGKTLWILEHRLVMEQHLGRELLPDEIVHHRDLNRLNNDLSNLELWTGSHPTGQRVSDVVAWCREMLERYDGADV